MTVGKLVEILSKIKNQNMTVLISTDHEMNKVYHIDNHLGFGVFGGFYDDQKCVILPELVYADD